MFFCSCDICSFSQFSFARHLFFFVVNNQNKPLSVFNKNSTLKGCLKVLLHHFVRSHTIIFMAPN